MDLYFELSGEMDGGEFCFKSTFSFVLVSLSPPERRRSVLQFLSVEADREEAYSSMRVLHAPTRLDLEKLEVTK